MYVYMYTDTYRIQSHPHTPQHPQQFIAAPWAYLLSQSTSWRVSNLASTQTDVIY